MSTTTENPTGTSTRTVVVVGHGMVGHRFVEALRSRDADSAWEVVVLSEEAEAAYDRVGLSAYVGAWDRGALALPGNSYAGDTRVDLRLGTRAEHVDREARTVTTSAGDVIAYDSLVLATGSYPFVPPVPGHESAGCFVYRTLDDLDGIRTAAESAIARAAAEGREANGLVVGGGLLGLEAANALRLLGLTPHVVEFAPRLMPLQVDEGGGAVLEGLISSLGVQVHTGAGTSSIAPQEDGRLAVEVIDGTALLTDLVVFSAGVRPSSCAAMELVPAPVCTCTPRLLMRLLSTAPPPSSTWSGMRRGANSTTCGVRPSRRRALAASRPSSPPPTTRPFASRPSAAARWMAASARRRMPSRSSSVR